jgi:hypothetical protein
MIEEAEEEEEEVIKTDQHKVSSSPHSYEHSIIIYHNRHHSITIVSTMTYI